MTSTRDRREKGKGREGKEGRKEYMEKERSGGREEERKGREEGRN